MEPHAGQLRRRSPRPIRTFRSRRKCGEMASSVPKPRGWSLVLSESRLCRRSCICQDTIFGGFAPNSQTAEVLSKALGSRTVMSGSVSKGKNDPSQSLQMMERALMTPDELKALPKGEFIVMKTGTYPMRTKLRLFLEWGITFEEPYQTLERAARKVIYAGKRELVQAILHAQQREQRVEECVDEEGPSPKAGYNTQKREEGPV